MHLPQHQELLRNAAKHGYLNQAIEQIQRENGKALHVESGSAETLSQRVFFHQPVRDIPMKGFVKHVDWATVEKATRISQASAGTSEASNSSENTNEACALAADIV
ncbi:hypothetical protein LMG27952_03119 [Paraburkholderia hiiakae]|uniref:Uncharacterized protein n=1 Tax=Paraburkholderia hiiakae TaxID=1081782 RepID=A0ABM8NP91_9BURK|nr:hypothetical protein [Paraburkholderia hiiakae]CAD6536210.1 hypothetical protein LMG27952_03119 [Paraburkholderia hiiakae]